MKLFTNLYLIVTILVFMFTGLSLTGGEATMELNDHTFNRTNKSFD